MFLGRSTAKCSLKLLNREKKHYKRYLLAVIDFNGAFNPWNKKNTHTWNTWFYDTAIQSAQIVITGKIMINKISTVVCS